MLSKIQKHSSLYILITFLLFLALIVLLVNFISMKNQNSNQILTGSLKPTDGYGIYDDCMPGNPECLSHLKIFAQGGFKLVLNYGSLQGSASQVITYADQAHASGLKVIWGLQYGSGNLATYYPA